jgi:hypothetical protein
VAGYDERYTGVTLSQASVSAANDTTTFVPPAYLATIIGGFDSLGRCSGSLSPMRIFFVHDVSGLALHYRGINVALARSFSRSLTVQLRFDLQSSVLARSVAALGGVSSPYIEGAQLPGEPLHRIGLTGSYAFADGKTDIIANAQYVSVNNMNRLPPYTVLSAALERRLSNVASVDVVATNVGRTYAALFSSSRYAVPLATASGPPLLLNAAPLAQPDIFVRFNLKLARTPGF